MARSSVVFFLFLVTVASCAYSVYGRRLLIMHDENKKPKQAQSYFSQESLYLSVLPKGTVPASTPTKKGHATIVNEKLIARHLAAIDRILRSVPSPGVGH